MTPDDTPERDLLATADLAKNVTRLALEHTAAQIAAGNHKDPAGAARNAAVVYGIAIDKLHTIQDRPQPPKVHGDPKTAALALARRLHVVIETNSPTAQHGGADLATSESSDSEVA